MSPGLEPGAELPSQPLAPVDRVTLALFAGASGDHNPVHVDPEHARRLGYDDVFAHGMLSMAWLGRVLTSWVGPDRLLSWSVRFTAPTPVGAVPTCSARVVSLTDGVADLALEVTLETGEVTLRGTARVAVDPRLTLSRALTSSETL